MTFACSVHIPTEQKELKFLLILATKETNKMHQDFFHRNFISKQKYSHKFLSVDTHCLITQRFE